VNPVVAFLESVDNRLEGAERSTSRPATEHDRIDSHKDAAEAPNASLQDPQQSGPPIDVLNPDDWTARFNDVRGDLDILLGILTGIGLTIAVLSIMNTMLMSVSERVIEFGVLKANGWSKGSVLKLIGLESILLGLTGGILGSVFGWLGTRSVNALWPDRVHLYASPGLLLFGVVLSALLGILGGLYPAHWATRMSPMEAIRRG